ncbi:hypothetical protein [Marinomonas algicola]|nr:hypothetical protein [Marinomonas algicola]
MIEANTLIRNSNRIWQRLRRSLFGDFNHRMGELYQGGKARLS